MKTSFRVRALILAAAVAAAMLALAVLLTLLDFQGDRSQASQWLGGTGMLLLVVALGLAWRVAHNFERPIASLRDAVNRVAAGDWHARIRCDEAGAPMELATAIDRMRTALGDQLAAGRAMDVMLDSMNDAVFVTSPEGNIKRINQSAALLLGWAADELHGRGLASLVSDQDRPGFDLQNASNDTLELTLLTKKGQVIPVSLSGSVMAADDPRFQGCIFVARNITERKRAERRIRYLARYDTLTKVPNRLQFQHSLQQAIARARRSGSGLALLYIDLDRFKEVNDTFGHTAGDRALEILSERMIARLPREAMLGRLAGDEFALFIENLPRDTDHRPLLTSVAREFLDELGKPFQLGTHELYVTASMGIALCPQDAENVVDLIRDADAAMYHSKQNGGNSHSFFTTDMSAVAVERLMLKSKLRRAVERNELVMLYQPKVDLEDGRVVGGEALLRWRLPGHGDISPAQFIPLAEESSLIQEIGLWVLKRVCSDYRSWQDQVPQPGRISINLSLRQLHQAEFITRYRSVFEDAGVSPSNFELEITETTLMTDARRMVRLLDELHAMGLHLSIDDFGTGYSSLSALQQFPVGTLKIDQSFVRHAVVSREDAVLVRTIIEMGKNLDLTVVAEGIESPEQLAFLKAHNCHYGQGRLFGEPMTAAYFLGLLVAQAHGQPGYSEVLAAGQARA